MRMQDLGGCRIIVPSIDNVYNVVNIITNGLAHNGHKIDKLYDRIKTPNAFSGYRSYHIVVEYHGNPDYEKHPMLVEVQVRTKLQHSWATAVETIDCIQAESLKAGTGNPVYIQFFKLVSALFSYEEKTPVVIGVPETKKEIVNQIYEIEEKYNIREMLGDVSQAVTLTGDYPDEADYFLLVLDRKIHSIEIHGFQKHQFERATKMYQKYESLYGDNNGINVVLVSISSISSLLDSYPNYYMNTKDFLSKLHELCSEFPEKPQLQIDLSIDTTRISELFNITSYGSCTPNGRRLREDGIGTIGSRLILCPIWGITLNNSYLRFSGIEIKEDDEIISGNHEIKPIHVNGPAVIVLQQGASFYVNKPEWYYMSSTNSVLFQPRVGVDPKNLLYLISWLKSNLFTWDLLWNKHTYSAYYLRESNSLLIPNLDDTTKNSIISIVEDILAAEHKFVAACPEDLNLIPQDAIDKFNTLIHSMLREIESYYKMHYRLSEEECEKISLGVKMKGYYSYTD